MFSALFQLGIHAATISLWLSLLTTRFHEVLAQSRRDIVDQFHANSVYVLVDQIAGNQDYARCIDLPVDIVRTLDSLLCNSVRQVPLLQQPIHEDFLKGSTLRALVFQIL